MGMFDTINGLKVKCPRCEGLVEDAQTKDLSCDLHRYLVGDYIKTKRFRQLDCICGCNSPSCREWELKRIGYTSGFGFCFDIFVYVDEDGQITGKWEYQKKED